MVNLTPGQLQSLQHLFRAIDQQELLLKHYSEEKGGPAYVQCNYVQNNPEIQLDRAIMTTAIRSQLTIYHKSLADLGVVYAKPTEID